jgi:putative ABC transport system permease protein
VMAGVAVGLPAAIIAGRLLQARLFGVLAHDPLVLSAGLALLAVSAGIAALLPAGRAARMDALRALRIE